MVHVNSATATSISLSWSVPSGSGMNVYEVMWQRVTSGECSNEDENSTTTSDGSISYDIMGLEEDSSYIITVTANNSGGRSSNTVTAMTLKAGEREYYDWYWCE